MSKPPPLLLELRRAPHMILDIRRRMTDATEKRYAGKPFAWGQVDCARVVQFHLRQLGWVIPRIDPYRSEIGAVRQLRKLDATRLDDVLDRIGLRRIAPAKAMLGDIFAVPGESPIGTLAIALGHDSMKLFVQGHDGLVTMRSSMIAAAWSVVPD